jgi:molecular chaperone DnaJ
MHIKDLKDHYRTLEVQPAARAEEIKKAFRRLAFKYHPDTNNSDYATAHFREIQEAYEILSDKEKRKRYDEERWLNGMSSRAKDQVVVTPEWILHESRRLSKHMETVDTYRMSHDALYAYIFLLLGDAHMAVLLQTEDHEAKREIVAVLLKATKALRYEYKEPVGQRLAELVPDDNEMLVQITEEVQRSGRTAAWERYMPWVVVGITLLLCAVMYFYSKN